MSAVERYRVEQAEDARWHIYAPDGYQLTTVGYKLRQSAEDEARSVERWVASNGYSKALSGHGRAERDRVEAKKKASAA